MTSGPCILVSILDTTDHDTLCVVAVVDYR